MTALQNREWKYLGRIMAALAVYEPESPLVERATRGAWAHLTGAHRHLAEIDPAHPLVDELDLFYLEVLEMFEAHAAEKEARRELTDDEIVALIASYEDEPDAEAQDVPREVHIEELTVLLAELDEMIAARSRRSVWQRFYHQVRRRLRQLARRLKR